jgi:hypothetical protein
MRALGLLALATVAILLFGAPVAGGQGGNQKLMEDLAKRKEAVRDQVLEQLRREGRIPEKGVIRFRAKVRPDLESDAGLQIEIQSLEIEDSAGASEIEARSVDFGSDNSSAESAADNGTWSHIYEGGSLPAEYALGEIEFSGASPVQERILIGESFAGGAAALSSPGEAPQPGADGDALDTRKPLPGADGASLREEPSGNGLVGGGAAVGSAGATREPSQDPSREVKVTGGGAHREEPSSQGWWDRFWRSIFPDKEDKS